MRREHVHIAKASCRLPTRRAREKVKKRDINIQYVMKKDLKIEIDHKRINRIVDKILNISTENDKVPEILLKPRTAFTLLTNKYFILSLLDKEGYDRVQKYMKEGNHPFPGLLAPYSDTIKAGFNLDNTKYAIFHDTKVVNKFSFKLGENSTAILYNHQVLINSKEVGTFKYNVELLYLISFGSEITIENFYDYLDELIDFSLTFWGL